MPCEHGEVLHAPVPHRMAAEFELLEALERLAVGNSRCVHARVRRILRRPGRQRKVQSRSLSRMRRLARPRTARLATEGTAGKPQAHPRGLLPQLGHLTRSTHFTALTKECSKSTPWIS